MMSLRMIDEYVIFVDDGHVRCKHGYNKMSEIKN